MSKIIYTEKYKTFLSRLSRARKEKGLTQKLKADARQKGLAESALVSEFLKKHYGL